MITPENILNNKNEQKEKLNQSIENQESIESAEDMQKRLSQEIIKQNEQLKNEDEKIETANDAIGLSSEEVTGEKNAMNLESEISNINIIAEKLMTESTKEINEKIESNESFSTQDLFDKIKKLSDQMSENPILYYSYGHWTEENKEEKEKAQKELEQMKEQLSPLMDKAIEELKLVAEKNPEKYRGFDSLKVVALGQGLKNIPTSFENKYVNNGGTKINKQNLKENMLEVNPGIGSVGMWTTENGRVSGKIKSGRVGGPFEIETNQGLVRVNKLYR